MPAGFDEHDALAHAGRLHRGGNAGRSAAVDDDVELRDSAAADDEQGRKETVSRSEDGLRRTNMALS